MRGIATGVIAGLLTTGVLLGPARAQPAPDVVRARAMYVDAEQAMKDGRYADAIRDYGATYELTHDPVLFFKIAAANERSGKCDVALIYYGRYVREAQPVEKHHKLVRDRVAACGGDPRGLPPPRVSTPDGGTGPDGASPDGASPDVPDGPPDGADPAEPGPDGTGGVDHSAGVLDPSLAAAPATAARPRHRGAWLMVAGSLAFVTIGSVLAYAAESAENDVDDLYLGLGGSPPAFDPRIRDSYDELVAEGRRYERLSWVSFGVATIAAVGAAVLFVTEEPIVVAPVMARDGGGVSAMLKF